MTDETDQARRTRIALVVAIITGALALVAIAFSVAEWSDWVLEINKERQSGATADILGRQGLMVGLALLIIATSLVASIWLSRPAGGGGLTVLGAVSALLLALLLALHWRRGFYYHLEHAGPLASVVLAGIQAVTLVVGGLLGRRR